IYHIFLSFTAVRHRPTLHYFPTRRSSDLATPSLGPELLRFADDDLPELRAAAARGLSYLPPGSAVTVLSELARDSVWFVRLRARSEEHTSELQSPCNFVCRLLLVKKNSRSRNGVRTPMARSRISVHRNMFSTIERLPTSPRSWNTVLIPCWLAARGSRRSTDLPST